MLHHGIIGFVTLGAVFLAVTGAEALYADLGHFGKRPIQTAWLFIVLPALAINYLGQGALLIADPKAIENPFFLMFPEWALIPMVALATAATVIASQAVITGAYSLTRQAIQLGLMPRFEIRHTSEAHSGQIYIPRINMIESRDVAEAKSDYLAARVTNELRQTISARQKTLLETRALSENEFLRTQLAATEAQIRLDSTRQKLFALGLSEAEIADLPNQPPESLRKQYLRAPISGRISERRVDLGGLIGREGQESELFVIVNLDDIWVDLAVSPEDIASVREGGSVSIRAIGIEGEVSAKIIFVSPLLDRETRNARVIASLPNPDHRWKPGTFVTAEIPLGDEASKVIVPRKALQTVKGAPTLFVRVKDGFEARPVKTRREDDDDVEVLSGLEPGETYAVANTFTLKAELEKAAAEHEH